MKPRSTFLALSLSALVGVGAAGSASGQGQGKGKGQIQGSGGAEPAALGKIDTAKLEDIRRLMKLTGAGNLGGQAKQQMLAALKAAMPNAGEAFWAEFAKEVTTDDLVAMVLPIYDKHLSHEEIKGIIKFFETPVGKKMLAAMPAITQETIAIGDQWSSSVAARAKKKLEAQKASSGPSKK